MYARSGRKLIYFHVFSLLCDHSVYHGFRCWAGWISDPHPGTDSPQLWESTKGDSGVYDWFSRNTGAYFYFWGTLTRQSRNRALVQCTADMGPRVRQMTWDKGYKMWLDLANWRVAKLAVSNWCIRTYYWFIYSWFCLKGPPEDQVSQVPLTDWSDYLHYIKGGSGQASLA